MNKAPRILLFVTNYNQHQEVTNFMSKLRAFWPLENMIVVDDGSTDGSDQIIESLGYQVIRHPQNTGVGSAIRTAILYGRENSYTHVLGMSSNGKMRPEDIQVVTKPILSGEADYVTGSRYLPGGNSPGISTFRNWMIPMFSIAVIPILGRRFSDITCGFRCYKIDFLFQSDLDITQAWLNRYEMEYYIHYWACRKRIRIAEVPVVIHYDHLASGRKSKIKPIVGWWSMIRPLVLLATGIKR